MVKPRLYALCSRQIHVTWNWEVRPQRCRNQVNFEWANRLSIFSALFSTPGKSGWVIAHPKGGFYSEGTDVCTGRTVNDVVFLRMLHLQHV